MEIEQTREAAAGAGTSWGMLLSEGLLFALMTALLFGLAWRVPDQRGDLGFLVLSAIVLHGGAFVRWMSRVSLFLAYDCPDCSYNFHGYPDRLPVPFRRTCAHCGAEHHAH